MSVTNLSDHRDRKTKTCFIKFTRTRWGTQTCYVILVEVTVVICQALELLSKGYIGHLMSGGKTVRVLRAYNVNVSYFMDIPEHLPLLLTSMSLLYHELVHKK